MHRVSFELVVRVVAVCIALAIWFFTSPSTALLWTVFLVFLAFRLDWRILGIGTLCLLAGIPITLSFEAYAGMAEQLAVYVFFLLCMIVGLQIIELRRELIERAIKIIPLKRVSRFRRKNTVRTPPQPTVVEKAEVKTLKTPLPPRRKWDIRGRSSRRGSESPGVRP